MNQQSPPDELPALAGALLDHLDRDVDLLAEVVVVLQEVRDGLRTADRERLSAIQERQAQMARRLETSRQQRLSLVGSIHAVVGPFTLRELAGRLPEPLAGNLLAAAGRARRLAARVDALNRGNGLLARVCLDFVNGCLSALQGPLAPVRYSRTGKTVVSARGSLLQLRG